jgi:phosphatidate cytidylyltransferase
MSRQFKYRLLWSILSLLILISIIYYSYVPLFKSVFMIVNGGIISLALLEYYKLTGQKGFQPLVIFGIGCSILYLVAVGCHVFYFPILHGLPFLILFGSLLLSFLVFFNNYQSAIGNLAVTWFGILYLTLPLSSALRVNYFSSFDPTIDGRLWLTYVLLMSKITDIGAYFIGKSLGKTPLASLISPKKTIAGAIGGLGVACLTSLLFFAFFYFRPNSGFYLTFGQSIWLSLLLSLLAQLGDLAESLLKRDARVKDSSQLPGLGGMLDIVDSLIFTIPLIDLLLGMRLVGYP